MASERRGGKPLGMAMVAVIMVLLVMTTLGMGMYKLVSSTIGVSGGFYRKATTRSVAVATGSMVMETIATSITSGTTVPAPGLSAVDTLTNIYKEMTPNNGVFDDSADPSSPAFAPDFRFTLGGITAFADVDFLQAVPVAGGSIEFASAYDGVGHGQALGSGFLIENQVRIIAVDSYGSRTEVRFIARQ